MLNYLSVHDLVWINTEIAGYELPFNYDRLEACMAAQYSYGASDKVAEQCANLLGTTLSQKPFAYANVRTAFVAAVAFSAANGFSLQVDSARAAEITRTAAPGEVGPMVAVELLFKPAQHTLRPGVTFRSLVTFLANEHGEAIKLLAVGDGELK